jgi:hypothetical protein
MATENGHGYFVVGENHAVHFGGGAAQDLLRRRHSQCRVSRGHGGTIEASVRSRGYVLRSVGHRSSTGVAFDSPLLTCKECPVSCSPGSSDAGLG